MNLGTGNYVVKLLIQSKLHFHECLPPFPLPTWREVSEQ